ncbi:ABC transporter permease [Streptomyces sp. NPDC048442]|uniref:ABC transporter permease n=1 Tax=Streptomyces sp. NPDC048442 TaxID=3154823 RepID=UPI003439F3A1
MSGPTSTSRLPGIGRVALWQHRRMLWAAATAVVLAAVATGGLRGWNAASGTDPSGHPLGKAHGLLRLCTEYGGTLLTVLPLAVGAFVAGPMIARELESGTYKVAWTQSVSPAQWLTSKLALPLVGAVLATSALVGVFRLGRAPFTESASESASTLTWYVRGVYEAMGPAVVGYTVLSIVLGALTGLLVRRTALAMGAAFLATGTVMLTLSSVRAHLWPAVTRLGPADLREYLTSEPGSMHVGGGWQTASGERLDAEACLRAATEAGNGQTFQGCMTGRGATQRYLDFHPESHFWPLQAVETGILLALAAGATWLAFRVLRKLHG